MQGFGRPWRRRFVVAVAAFVMVAGLAIGGSLARSAFGQDTPSSQEITTKTVTETPVAAASPVTKTPVTPEPAAVTKTPVTSKPPAVKTTWVTTTKTIVSGGRTRSYLVVEQSPAPTGKVPVVVVLHGSAVTPQIEERRTGLLPVVGSAILVYPAGYQETWNAGHCCGAAYAAGVNDEAFVTAVVAQVLAEHPNADSSKVDLVGYSNGGRLAWSLACDDPSVFRAVAVYGAVLDKSCSRLGPVSGIEIAGRSDPEIDIDASKPAVVSFGFTEPTVTAVVGQLRVGDGCSAVNSASNEGRVAITTWASCADGRRVALALYQGQNHDWPTGGGTTPAAQVVIWQFLASIGAT